ncbi:hypothetical protein [Kribbella sp. NPDC051770]|uniref:hypothetical protein n=1 Tax=Kribbella sp. NPDC051770 TaxID=3155413 RepID=UPI0034131D4E
MGLQHKAWQIPLRLGAGVFILGSGLGKVTQDAATADQTHGFAVTAYPMLGKVEPRLFLRALGAGELALGTALLIPVVPTALVGLGLTAFSTGLLGLYLRGPGLRREGSLRPTEQGMGIAKDVWLLAIGAAFVVDELEQRRRDGRRGRRR